MKNICIGIISYLPDDINIRNVRISRLTSLIAECDSKLSLPIIIIAQNWKDFQLPKCINSKLIIYDYNYKLGITSARIKLREVFLNSEYTNIILIDDDLELNTKDCCDNYITEINTGDYDYYYIEEFLNNYCCISKNGFNIVNYDSTANAELGTGFEDVIFKKACLKYLKSKQINSIIYKQPRKAYINDKYSTWELNVDKSIINNNYVNARIKSKNI